MSSDDTFGYRSLVIDIDIETRDIHRIWSQVQSDYIIGRRILSEARSLLYKDQKKTLKLLKRAHREFIRESSVATEYNSIRERIRFLDGSSTSKLDKKYHEELASGNYDAARKIVRKLSERTIGLEHPLSIARSDTKDGSISLRFNNKSDRMIVVILIRGTNNGKAVVFDHPSFSLQPFGEMVVTCSELVSDHPLDIVVEYRDKNDERSIPVSIALR